MNTEVAQCVEQITTALETLSALFEDPSRLEFEDIHKDMELLEAQFKQKATIDAAFAFIAERDQAGRTVGANYANAYLQQCLDLSKGEAYNRLQRGRLLFAPPEPPPPPPPPADEDAEDLFSGADGNAGAGRQQQEEEQRQQQSDARKHAAQVSAEKQDIIRRELDKLLLSLIHI